MGKYEPLAQFLGDLADDSWTATFDQIESKLGFTLPPSAAEHRAWWSNQTGPGHSQKEAWQAAGWETSEVDLKRKVVRFERRRNGGGAARSSRFELLRQAKDITGIADNDLLIEAGLTALIQREAGRRLAALGGTMPDAWAPPRRRPDIGSPDE